MKTVPLQQHGQRLSFWLILYGAPAMSLTWQCHLKQYIVTYLLTYCNIDLLLMVTLSWVCNAEEQHTIKTHTPCSKKSSPLMFDNNFGRCEPIFKILSPGDLWENYVHTTEISTSPAIFFYTTLWKSNIQKCYQIFTLNVTQLIYLTKI